MKRHIIIQEFEAQGEEEAYVHHWVFGSVHSYCVESIWMREYPKMADRNRVSGIVAAVFYWMIVCNLDSPVYAEVSAVTLSILPTPQWNGTLDALIHYRSNDAANYTFWTSSLETSLNDYKTPGLVPGRHRNIFNCDYDQPPPPGKVCDVDIRSWGPCVSENHFNYHRSAPCIFLKIDTPAGWIPEYYNDTGSLPAEMPVDLRSYITSFTGRRSQLNSVWVSCEGVYPADKEFIGPIQYLPRRGFPGYYFLNNQADGFLSPVVPLLFERPQRGIVINIKCKAWARNIDFSTGGAVQFAVMID